MEIENFDKTFIFPKNVEILTFIGSRNSPEIRYVFDYFHRKETQNETNSTIYFFKWASLLNENVLVRIQKLFQETNSQETESEDDYLKQIINSKKPIKFIIAINLNDYENFEFEEMNGLQLLTQVSSKIFYFSFSNQYYFEFCMVDRVSKDDFYNFIWPNYVSFSQLILSNTKESKLVLIDNMATLRQIVAKIEHNHKDIQTSITKNKLLYQIESKFIQKSSQTIRDLITKTKRNFFLKISQEIEPDYLKIIKQKNYKFILEYLIDLYSSRELYSFEEKSVFKNVFVNGTDNLVKDKFLTVMIKAMMELLDKEESIELVQSSMKILIMLSRHVIFKHGVFNNELFVNLIYRLLESKSQILKCETTALISLMLSTDYKRYGSLFVDYDTTNSKSIILLLYETVINFYQDYTNDNIDNVENLEKIALYDAIHVQSLEYCLKFGNCNQLNLEQIENLFNLCVNNRMLPFKRIKVDLYGILNMLLRYGPSSFWMDKKKMALIMNDVYQTLIFLLENNFTKGQYWPKCSSFLKEILFFVQKNPHFDSPESTELEFGVESVKKFVDSVDPEMINTINSEHLSVINELNQNFFVKYIIQTCACSESNSPVFYSNFLYRSQHYYDKKFLIKSLQDYLVENLKDKKIVKSLCLFGELILKEVIGQSEVEECVNEWFDRGLSKLAVGLNVIIGNKFQTNIFDKFKDEKFENFEAIAQKHESIEAFLEELFGVKTESLVQKYHENFVNYVNFDLDFHTEYAKAVEFSKLEILEIKSQNEVLKNSKKSLEKQLKDLREELKRVESDRLSKINEIDKLRKLNANLKNTKIKDFKIEEKILSEKIQKISLNESGVDLDLIDDEASFSEIDTKLEPNLCRQILNTLKFKRQTFKEFRSLIRGSLKHLSVNLYTSPYQFLSEIIQNFEDTQYDSKTEPWFIKLIIDKDYLLFCNNEIGFRTKDIKSICSCSESSKQKGVHIGHKGLGFKSVFLCSDNPVIVSKKWQFEFRKEKDEISFITPHYLDKIPSELENYVSKDLSSNTFIFLPLKDGLKYTPGDVKSEKYFNDIQQNIDPNILLFTNKIKKLVIINKIKGTETIIECQNTTLPSSVFDYEYQEKTIKIENLETRVKLYHKKVRIPSDLVESEELSSDITELTIGFPESKNGCKVFAFLPICDLKFNFVLNASWILVTNRETINLNSAINSFYRDKIAEFFIEIIKTQVDLRHNILDYIPKNFALLNDFWKQFVTDIKYGLKTIISESLNFNNGLKTYVYNADLCQILTNNFSSQFQIKLINPNETGIDYEYYGFTKITVSIILDHFGLVDCPLLDDDWWINFFRLLDLNFSDEIKQKCLKSNIFLVENKRTKITIDNRFYLLIDDGKELKSWRKELVLIDHKSLAERNFISSRLKLPKITKDYLKNYIKNLHLDQTKLGPNHLVWQDLNFIKQNFPNDVMVLYVSTIDKKLVPIHKACSSRVIGYDLSSLTTNKTLIDFENKGLDWEVFFIRQKCKFPQLDLIENKIDQLFTGFSTYSSNDLILVNDILDLIDGYKIKDFLLELPIKTRYLTDENYITLMFKTCLSTIYDGYLPSIDIPSNMFELAEKLGVSIRLDFAKCLKVLFNLISNHVNNPSVYIDWFLNLKSTHDKEVLPDVELITLEDSKSYKIKDLYCCDLTPGLKLFGKYLKKGLINFECNSVYKPIESILIQFGAKVKPSFEDSIKCLIQMKNDIRLFNNKSKTNCLSNYGFEDIYQMFYTLEMALRSEISHDGMVLGQVTIDYEDIDVNDLEKREQILNLVISKKELLESKYGRFELPIVTYDNHVYNQRECKLNSLFVCFQSDLLLTLSQKNPDFLFLNQLIFKKCPYVLALLNGEYLTNHIKLYLSHINSNIEEVNYAITKVFREATGVKNLQIAKAKYMPLRVKLNREQDETIEPDRVNNTISYAIFKKNWVYLVCREKTGVNLAIILTHALKSCLKIFHPTKSDSALNSESKSFISRISKADLNYWDAWEYSCSKVSIFDLNEIIFADDELDPGQFSEVFFTSNSTSENFNKYIKSTFISEHDCYMKKLQIEPEKLKINEVYTEKKESLTSSLLSVEPFEVNNDKQKASSIKSEHFFCCYLKSVYGDQFNEYKNWVSSARNRVYPSNLHSYDDSLGYDFEIIDHKNLFSSTGCSSTESNKCFIEVKGTEKEWDGTFHISKNELETKDKVGKMNDGKEKHFRYVVVIVEWVCNPEMTRIAMVINWTENNSIVKISPESYIASYSCNKKEIKQKENMQEIREEDNRQSSRGTRFDGAHNEIERNRNRDQDRNVNAYSFNNNSNSQYSNRENKRFSGNKNYYTNQESTLNNHDQSYDIRHSNNRSNDNQRNFGNNNPFGRGRGTRNNRNNNQSGSNENWRNQSNR